MDKAIEVLVNTLNVFITRDVIYLAGGAIVLAAAFYAIRQDLFAFLDKVPTYAVLIALVVAHNMGYAVTVAGHLTGFVVLTYTADPGAMRKVVHSRYIASMGSPTGQDARFPRPASPQEADARAIAERDRVIFLKTIGATMAVSFLLVAVSLISRIIYVSWSESGFRIDAFMAGASIFLVVLFWSVNAVLAVEQNRFVSGTDQGSYTKSGSEKAD
ncbi:hypothetical protein EJV46_06475 [Roseococcus sp. SYP-B2431]|uniref:hypothetical protein n=1 Tax=Roseococcus sp. SYP-B2431 TaxID=2496640 RepID=UPI00103F1421|nr:hypothetical protein [Roseococcus sp. SYP-B2431]TCI00277.1 hypothetical protein EJV46_06475 [Roseococcus sp. SYP-B2431]